MFTIISGTLKGTRILARNFHTVRPTTNFSKKALFGILDNYLDYTEVKVLDLYSGLGSISLEFASRGAKKITLVDNNKEQIKFVSSYIKKYNFVDVFSLFKEDVFKWLTKKSNYKNYNFIFADPPFKTSLNDYQKLLMLILSKRLLSIGSYFVLEHYANNTPIKNEYYIETRKYGKVAFSFYRKHI